MGRGSKFMAYQALYRKFRPDRFEDVRGQDVIVTTLKNQIKADRIGHAYLFTGTRGTGKTTVAKLFAKAVNCTNRKEDGSPCGECPNCRAIQTGSSMNVVEIDAASNNGVDNIREIRDEVSYPPTDARFRVYIIDEVHMLSAGAFNALLKTLEEPPSYVIFILATTEINKIPATILSRCQRYDFHRMTIETMVKRMREICDRENIEVEDKALNYIARCGNGSMRDSLSLLDQCASFHIGQQLTYDKALQVLGAVDTSVYSRFLEDIVGKDLSGALRILDDVLMQGRDLSAFITDFIWYLRNLLLISAQDQHMEDVIDVSSEALEVMKKEAEAVSPDVLMRFIRILSTLQGDVRFSTEKRVLTEIAIIKLMQPAMESDLGSLKQRIEDLEQKIENGIAVNPGFFDSAAGAEGINKGSAAAEKYEKVPLPDALPEDVEQVAKNWKKIYNQLEQPTKNMVRNAHPTVDGGQLIIVFDEDKRMDYAFVSGKDPETGEEKEQEALQEAINKVIGKNVSFKLVLQQEKRPFNTVYADLSSLIQFDGIEIVDESSE